MHYQRRHGAFALHDPATLDWPTLLGGLDGARPWLHMTGITPMVSAAARQSWDAAIGAAAAAGIPMSLDLNHRKQLGTLAELWAIVEPHVAKFYVIILSPEQLNGLCAHLNLGLAGLSLPIADDADDADVIEAMKALRSHTRAGELALCRKMRDAATGVQRRWSLVVRPDGGGFTRWSSGPTSASFSIRHASGTGRRTRRRKLGVGGRVHPRRPLRERHEAARAGDAHADLLAALCQSAGTSRAWRRARGGGGGVRRQGRGPAPAPTRRCWRRPEPAAARRDIEATLRGCGRRARSRSCAPRGRRRRRWRAASSSMSSAARRWR